MVICVSIFLSKSETRQQRRGKGYSVNNNNGLLQSLYNSAANIRLAHCESRLCQDRKLLAVADYRVDTDSNTNRSRLVQPPDGLTGLLVTAGDTGSL